MSASKPDMVGVCAAAPAARASEGLPSVLSVRHAETSEVYFLSNLRVTEGRHHPFIALPRTCRKVRSQSCPHATDEGRKEVEP